MDFLTLHYPFINMEEIASAISKGDRPTWDEYFMIIALVASSRSPCQRLHVGCVLVRDHRMISMGYNGFLPGEAHVSVMSHAEEAHDGRTHELATVHAEQNAICYVSSTSTSMRENGQPCIAYITHYPCLNCAKLLYASGVRCIYYHYDYHNDPNVKLICSQMTIIQI